jgi:chemotaxis protein CheC
VQTELTEPQWDALRELANVGAGHAASALSRLLAGERLGFQPPEAWRASAREFTQLLGGDSSPWLATVLEVSGDVSGTLWLVFGRKDAHWLATRILVEANPDELAVNGVLTKVAQEVGAAALSAMGKLTGLSFKGATPVLLRSAAGVLATGASENARVLALDALLRAKGFAAQLLFLPDAESLDALLKSLRV